MADEITNSEDIIDSRDVIARIEELRRNREIAEDPEGPDPEFFPDWEEDELLRLEALAVEGSDYAEDWEYGAALIRDSYFVEYAQELAEDIGAVNRDAAWPNNHIDWGAAAEELKVDYTGVDFDGVTYWVR
jgi:hypothetical protein